MAQLCPLCVAGCGILFVNLRHEAAQSAGCRYEEILVFSFVVGQSGSPSVRRRDCGRAHHEGAGRLARQQCEGDIPGFRGVHVFLHALFILPLRRLCIQLCARLGGATIAAGGGQAAKVVRQGLFQRQPGQRHHRVAGRDARVCRPRRLRAHQDEGVRCLAPWRDRQHKVQGCDRWRRAHLGFCQWQRGVCLRQGKPPNDAHHP